MQIVVILLSWRRVGAIRNTLSRLSKQTRKDFVVHISNGNIDHAAKIDEYARLFPNLKINVTHDGNDNLSFRRFLVARDYAEAGYDIILFLDDDIVFPTNYVDSFVKSYKPGAYYSDYAWTFQKSGSDYYKYRTRVYSNDHEIKYGGTGVSMIDPAVFLDKRFFKAPREAYDIEDLWLSYFCTHVLKWKIKYVGVPRVTIGGGDSVALYKQIKRRSFNKADFLRMLVRDYGWNV